MVSPPDGSTVSGTFTISASINGSYGSVVFWVDNWQQIGQSSSPQLSYNSGALSNGNHQFFVSVLDSAGNTLCASNIVTANVQNSTTATMVSPANGSTVSGTITISATINSTVGYSSVAFWIDSWTKIGQAASPQLSYNTAGIANGNHNFFVTVLDSTGAALAASNVVMANVQNPSGCTPVSQMASVDQNGFDMLAAFNNTNTGASGPYFGAGDPNWPGGWYFVNLAYLGYVDLMPDTVKGYIGYYLQNTNSDWSIGANPDSDDSYAATILSLASAYYRITCDQGFYSTVVTGKGVTVLQALKNVATNNLVNATFSYGLVHVFQNVNQYPVALTEDNSEDYKGLADFGKLLTAIGDGSASTYVNAAAALASGMQQTHESNLYNGSNYLNEPGFAWGWQTSGPAWMDNPIKFYPDGVTQIFPQAYRVPVPSYMYSDGWNFLSQNFDFENPGVSDDPWTLIGLAATYNGDNTTANAMLSKTRNWSGVPIHEWGFYRRIVLYQEYGFVYGMP
jgi:hypothetical protein